MEPEHDQRSRPNETRHDLNCTLYHSEQSEESLTSCPRPPRSKPEMLASLNMTAPVVEQKLQANFQSRIDSMHCGFILVAPRTFIHTSICH